MNPFVLLLVVAVVGVVAFFAVLRLSAPIARRKLEELGQHEDLAGAELQAQSSFYGVGSKGRNQARSLGVLALGPEELRFRPVAGTGAIDVPRAAITGAELTEEFAGTAQRNELLVVTWNAEDGPETAAWRLAEPAPWLAALA